MADNYSAHAVECTGCGHLDAHMVRYCPVCGRATEELADVCEAMVPAAIRRDVELVYVKDEPEFDQVGGIAALLRFRTDQTKGRNLCSRGLASFRHLGTEISSLHRACYAFPFLHGLHSTVS